MSFFKFSILNKSLKFLNIDSIVNRILMIYYLMMKKTVIFTNSDRKNV